MRKCKTCGITFESAHISYDGYRCPSITKKCGYYTEKCDEKNCMNCCLDGGHVFIKNGNGRHKWEVVE